MDEAANRELDPEFRVLQQEAIHLERVVRETNNLPDNFPEEAFLNLCRASRLTAVSPPEQRPLLLRYLSDTLAALHPALPRLRNAETREHEFPHLNGAFNALQAEVLHLANTIRDVPPPPTPGEPRNDPDSPDVVRIVERGRETVQAVQGARETLDASEGMSLTQTNIENRSFVNVVINGNLNWAEAGAMIGSVAAPLKEVTSRTLDGLGTLMTDWTGHTRRSLNAAGFGLEVGTDVVKVFGLTSVADKTEALGKVLRHHAARLSKPPGTISILPGTSPAEDSIDDLFDLMGAALRRDDTEKATDLAGRILAHSKAEEKLPLHSFDLQGSSLANVSPLAEFFPLQSLSLSGTDVTDVGALWRLGDLKALDLSATGVTDVGALSGLAGLRSLDLSRTRVSDIGALSSLTGLQSLDLRGSGVTDIGALSGLVGLQVLNLDYTNVTDISALSGLVGLWTLGLRATGVTDVGALSSLTGLQSLDLSSTGVTDVSALAGLTDLRSLDLGMNDITDVSALSGLTGLQSLDLSGSDVTDISALSGLTNLRSFSLIGTSVTDVSTLSSLTGLLWLDLSHTSVTDVSVLSGLPNLQELFLPEGIEDNRSRS
ncbi:MAG: leucine-rich repeat domain-containing protein [Pseudomonadota bacterium]|nr:leucine-rich repeat domain-containing protein [Pseudomonadota bacterium]